MATASMSAIEKLLWPNGNRRDAWMIVDAARDRRIFGLLLECFYSQHTCLFSGDITPQMQLVAPYLVELDYEHQKTRHFLRQAWGNNWGVFLKCEERMATLRRHLRTILVVRDQPGNRLLFRYYDPRVLRVYLPTCTKEELDAVFGPIERFLAEGEETDELLEFCRLRGELITTDFKLQESERTDYSQVQRERE